MEWWTPRAGVYEIVAAGDDGTVLTTTHRQVDADGRLQVKLQTKTVEPIRITVRMIGS